MGLGVHSRRLLRFDVGDELAHVLAGPDLLQHCDDLGGDSGPYISPLGLVEHVPFGVMFKGKHNPSVCKAVSLYGADVCVRFCFRKVNGHWLKS